MDLRRCCWKDKGGEWRLPPPAAMAANRVIVTHRRPNEGSCIVFISLFSVPSSPDRRARLIKAPRGAFPRRLPATEAITSPRARLEAQEAGATDYWNAFQHGVELAEFIDQSALSEQSRHIFFYFP